MSKNQIYIGNNKSSFETEEVKGELIDFENENYYKISNSDGMRPFFMSIVSDSNHWMFISSNGGLSAGRKDAESSLFPYYTVDKIHDYRGITGSSTYFLVNKKGKTFLWEPFTDESLKFYTITRNLYKSIYGNKIIFEEVNAELGLSFHYGWRNSERFGFVKKSGLKNLSNKKIEVTIYQF